MSGRIQQIQVFGSKSIFIPVYDDKGNGGKSEESVYVLCILAENVFINTVQTESSQYHYHCWQELQKNTQRERAKTFIYALALKMLFLSLYLRFRRTWSSFAWLGLQHGGMSESDSPTEVNRPRFLAANLFLYLCLNLVYEDKGHGGKSEEGGNSVSAMVNGYRREIFSSMHKTNSIIWQKSCIGPVSIG